MGRKNLKLIKTFQFLPISRFLCVVLVLFFTQAEFFSAWAKDSKPTKQPKKILKVEDQISEDLRKQQLKNKEAERETAKALPPPLADTNPFQPNWNLQCRPDQNNCFESKGQKNLPKRSDGVELGK